MRALKLSIYKDRGGDCSNGGISSKFDDILLICDEGFIDVKGDEPNLCKLVTRNLFGKEYKHVEPVAEPKGIGYMAGGTIVYTCDSRFGRMSEYPLSLHDRCESKELYDALSR